MRRQAVVLAMCVVLSVPALPGITLGGGKMLGPTRASFKVSSEFRPKSAFGGPGGFPLPIGENRHDRHFFRRVPHHAFFPRFPVTTFWYPTAFYSPPFDSPPVDPAPPVVTVSPVVYVAPTVYIPPPTASVPPATVAAALPAAPSQPSVVEYPTGRYELRGDGVGTAYTWVWIPNPPAAPPSPSPREDPPSASSLPAERSQTYRWTDETGTTFWTNRLEKVPEPYRARAQGSASIATPQ